MKNIFLAIFVIAISITSCSKKQTVKNDLLPQENNYYCNSQKVNYESEITNLNDPNASVVMTDQLDGKLSFYHFDNQEMSEQFINAHPELSELKAKINQVKKLRAYAEKIGEDEYVKNNGASSPEFTAYIEKEKTRAFPIKLYNNINYLPAPGWPVLGPTPVLVAGINNLSRSAMATNNNPMAVTFWDGNNFTGGSFFAFAISIPNLGAASLKISSVN